MEKEQTQTKRNHQSKEEEATRKEAKMKEQQAQAKRSHQRKEEEATRNRFMGGFCEENINETRRRQGKKTQAPTPKEQKATRNETKMKNHKRKQNAITKHKKKRPAKSL